MSGAHTQDPKHQLALLDGWDTHGGWIWWHLGRGITCSVGRLPDYERDLAAQYALVIQLNDAQLAGYREHLINELEDNAVDAPASARYAALVHMLRTVKEPT